MTRIFYTALLGVVLSLPALTGCAIKTTGEVKDDVTLTDERAKLEEVGVDYTGPEYTVAILEFGNKTPSKVLGIGEAATDILRTLMKKSGLEPIVLSDEELAEQEKLMALEQRGALKRGMKDLGQGFESVDLRLSGSVTSYSEHSETYDLLVGKTKTVIARVQVDYALVDVATGKSIVADSGTGEYRKRTREILGFGTRATADVGLRDGALRDALTRALRTMVEKLNKRPFTGRVLLVEGESIFIKAGERSKLGVGSTLNVFRPGAELIDPDTGRSLGRREKKIGEIVIAEHQNERVSIARTGQGGGFKRGDVVKVP